MARKMLPNFIKNLLRFFYYPQERRKIFREVGIRKIQDQAILQYNHSTDKLIVFIVNGADYDLGTDKISGGIISIVSLCNETKKIKNIHGAEVVMTTLPGHHLLAKHNSFKNNVDVLRFAQLENYFSITTELIVHVPEYLCNHFVELAKNNKLNWLKKKRRIHVNIMNQNVRLMPSREEILSLQSVFPNVTITTAHQQYCTDVFRKYYRVPIHKFSVWISPENYHFKRYSEKENIIIVSPDGHPERETIIERLANIPGLFVRIIQNLTYEQYKETISKAKWALTFGEGLDGYLIEPIFSGAIGFAVYNEDFFTNDFRAMKGIFSNYKELYSLIESEIRILDNPIDFEKAQSKQFELCARHYDFRQYQDNIRKFYLQEYTFA